MRMFMVRSVTKYKGKGLMAIGATAKLAAKVWQFRAP